MTCPSADELVDLLLGRLPLERGAEVEQHLDSCERCLAVVEKLQVKSHVVDALKERVETNAPDVQPDLKRLMSLLEEMHPSTQGDPADPSEDLSLLAPPGSPDELGRLGSYRVLELIGSGGMGVVYRAEDTQLRRAVALKVLRSSKANNNDARKRFLREAQAAACIKHDHVVAIHQVGEDRGVPFLAMELLRGQSLRAWMQANPRAPWPVIVRIGRQVAEALTALHARGLIHRDVKPGNLWLEDRTTKDESGTVQEADAPFIVNPSSLHVKLLDFGLARAADDAMAGPVTAGTLAYMAPEQLQRGPLDGRCDLFGLGCVLYELCTGELPFPDRRFSSEHTVPFPVCDINPAIPPALAQLITQLLQEDPAARPASARQVAEELAKLEGSPEKAPPTPAAVPASAPASATPNSHASLLIRLRPWLALAAVAETLAFLAGFLWWGGLFTAPPFPPGPPDDEWCQKVQQLPAKDQWKAVLAKLEELNPGYHAAKTVEPAEPDAAVRFSDQTDFLTDIRPLHALAHLKNVILVGSEPGAGKLTDLEPLKGMKLVRLTLARNRDLKDLAPLRGMPLYKLDLADTSVASLADLADCPLVDLTITDTPVKDLAPLKGIASLQTINGLPTGEFWRQHGSTR